MKCPICKHEMIDHYKMLHHCPKCESVWQSKIDMEAEVVTLFPRTDLKPRDCGSRLPSIEEMKVKED